MLSICVFLLGCSLGSDVGIELGNRRELFVDSFLIERMEGTSLRMHEPQPANVVLTFEKPWEGLHCGYITVFQDGDRYRMYYRGLPVSGKDGTDAEVTCYAESPDGIHFSKPDLGLFQVGGTLSNNVILAGMPPFSHNFAPFLDARPGVPAEERYKALAGTQDSGLAAFISEDGLRWRKMREEPVITEGAFDSQNVAFWSGHEDCYVAYFRTWSEGGWKGYRWVSRSTSKDFRTWTPPVEMDKGDAPWEHIYTNQTLPYYRAPHLYISIAARFMPGRQVIAPEAAERIGVAPDYFKDCSDCVLMTSRGGNRYDRTFMEGFLKPGIGPENWISRTNYPVYGLVPVGETGMSLYIQQNYAQPTHRVRRYELRPDGFVSISAPYAGGEFLTKVFTFAGTELHLNFSTSAAGSIRVELQDEKTRAIDGHTLADSEEIIGNLIDRVVMWKGNADLSAFAGRPVRVRFVMRDADLYSLCFQ